MIRNVLSSVKAIVEYAMSLLIFLIVVLTFLDVAGRTIFSAPVFGAHDLTEHFMAGIIFLGMPILTLAGGHLTIDLFDKYILRKEFRYWRLAVSLAVAGTFAFMALLMFRASSDAARFHEVSQALNIPRTNIYLLFSASLLLSSIAALIRGFVEVGMSPEQITERDADQ